MASYERLCARCRQEADDDAEEEAQRSLDDFEESFSAKTQGGNWFGGR